MSYVNIVVEGQTEETFVRDLLSPWFGELGIFVVARRVETGRKRGHIFRGGVSNYQKIRRDIIQWLKQRNDAWCTTMFDLYGLPQNFPGLSGVTSQIPPYVKVKSLETALEDDIDHRRFIPYIQLHEFESLVFTDVNKINSFYVDKRQAIERLQRHMENLDTPEMINDGPDTHPSKRIIKEIPEYYDDKALVGPMVVQAIGLEKLRQSCPHFNDWICQIEKLAE